MVTTRVMKVEILQRKLKSKMPLLRVIKTVKMEKLKKSANLAKNILGINLLRRKLREENTTEIVMMETGGGDDQDPEIGTGQPETDLDHGEREKIINVRKRRRKRNLRRKMMMKLEKLVKAMLSCLCPLRKPTN